MRSCTSVILLFLMILPARAELRSTAKWLVDLGRSYPLSSQAGLSDNDARLTLAFMQAATRINPKLAEGYYWQFDLLRALGRDNQALQALDNYILYAPSDVPAALKWVNLKIDSLQTAEKRIEFCQSQLKNTSLHDPVYSLLHLQLSQIFMSRGEQESARVHAQAAVEAYPYNLSAKVVLHKLKGQSTGPVFVARNSLAVISDNPTNIQQSWELADLLVSYQLPQQANLFYQHAINIFTIIQEETPIELLLDQTTSLIESKDWSQAQSVLNKILRQQPDRIDARLTAARLAELQDNSSQAEKHLKKAATIWEKLLEEKDKLLQNRPAVVSEAAWFFAHYRNRPQQAADLAREVLAKYPQSASAKRAFGSAQRQLDQRQEARQTLEPLAEQDPWARVELARLLWDTGEKQKAKKHLLKAAELPSLGHLRDTIERLSREWRITLPQSRPSTHQKLKEVVGNFDRKVLDYPFHPQRYLTFELSVETNAFDPVQPWWCTFKLVNTGPFPVTLGPDDMVMPEALCTINTFGKHERTSGPTIRVSLYKTVRLQPGESINVRQTLDIGPIHGSMIGTPQIEHNVDVSAILSPVSSIGADSQQQWEPGVGGFMAEPLSFTRSSFSPTRDTINKLITLSRHGDLPDRRRATKLLAMLLAEQQHLSSGRLRYSAETLSKTQLRKALFDRINDNAWQVRALLAEACRWITLSATDTRHAMKLLNDDHWLVRGLTLRALSDHYGNKLANVLQSYHKNDSDPWVRNMCSTLLHKLEGSATTTQP